LPEPQEGKCWNKKLAMQAFHNGQIAERKLGYILAAVEHDYRKVFWSAEADFACRKISESEFKKTVEAAKIIWLGE
jgi:hypothetical protein